MAQDKKSFIAYADWKNIFDELPNEDAGKLIKHIFSYVNDENPETDSILIRAVFANIRSTLKRDLDKWDKQLEQRRLAGKASAEVRKNNSLNDTDVRLTVVDETTRNSTDNVNDNVNDNVILLEKETKYNFDFKKSLIDAGCEKKLAEEWLKVRKTKKATNTETALKTFLIEVAKSEKSINEVLTVCISQSWSGFRSSWKIEENGKPANKSSPTGFASNR